MKAALTLAVLAPLALAACDNAKPRPAAATEAERPFAPVVRTPIAKVDGLEKRPEMPGFSLDAINAAPDPINKPATIQADASLTVSGFGFDPVAKTPGKALHIVIDGAGYATDYGAPRGDVATYFKAEALTPTGFRAVLPPGTVRPGAHTALVRVVAADGKSYFDGPAIAFTAK